MKRFLIFIFLLCFVSVGWSATYYVSQAGTGDGSTLETPDSVADANGGAFGELDGDTVYYIDSITSQINIPDSGSNGSVAIYRGDYAGREATVDTSSNYGILINNKDYVEIRGFNITGAVVNGINYYVNTGNSTDVSIIGNTVDGNDKAEITAAGIQALAAGYDITNLVLTNNVVNDCDGTGIYVYGTEGGVFVTWEIHDNATSGNGRHGQAFSDVGTNTQTIYNLTSIGDGDDPANAGWMGVAVTAINVNETSFTQESGNIYYADVTGDTVYYVLNNTDLTQLAESDGNWASLTNGQWDQNGDNLYFNIGGDPTGKTIRYAKGRAENITLYNIVVSGTIDATGSEGDGFTFDGFASNNTLYKLDSRDNEGSGFISNMGSGNVVYSSIAVNNDKYGFNFLKQHDSTKHELYHVTANGNTKSGVRTSSALVVLDVYNSIFASNTEYGGSGATDSTITSDYNILYGNGIAASQNAYSVGGNSIQSDPLQDTNYRIASNSPARDSGTDKGITTDACGNPVGDPSMGHCEYGQSVLLGGSKSLTISGSGNATISINP